MSEMSPRPLHYNPDILPIGSSNITLERLHREYIANPPRIYSAGLLQIAGLPEGCNAYNPSILRQNGKVVLLGRVAQVGSERSDIYGFSLENGFWKSSGVVVSDIEDFSVRTVVVDGEPFLLGQGVKVGVHPDDRYKSEGKTYFNVFWCVKRIEDIAETPPFAYAPPLHKDSTPIQFRDRTFGIFTRPQEEQEGKENRGTIGYQEFRYLDDLSKAIETAEPVGGLEELFDKKTVWGGFTDGSEFGKDSILAGGHCAYYIDEERKIVREGPRRRYDAMSAIFNRRTRRVTAAWVDIMREDLPDCDPRRIPGHDPEDLGGVVFAMLWLRSQNGTVLVTGGVGDNNVFTARIEDRSRQYEEVA